MEHGVCTLYYHFVARCYSHQSVIMILKLLTVYLVKPHHLQKLQILTNQCLKILLSLWICALLQSAGS